MRSKWVCAPLVAVLALGGYAASVLATPSAGVTTTTIAKSPVDELDINAHTIPADRWHLRLKTQGVSDAYVIDNTLAKNGGTTGWHSHPGPSLIFVVAGTVTNYTSDDPCTGHTYSKGDAFIDEGGDHVHMLRNEGAVDARTIAVQLIPKDAPRRIDAPDPGTCGT